MFGLKECEFSVVTVDVDSDEDGQNDTNIDCQVPTDGSLCACAASVYLQPAIKSQRGKWPANQGVKDFLSTLLDKAAPVRWNSSDFLLPKHEKSFMMALLGYWNSFCCV